MRKTETLSDLRFFQQSYLLFILVLCVVLLLLIRYRYFSSKFRVLRCFLVVLVLCHVNHLLYEYLFPNRIFYEFLFIQN
jgi:hypothetical protein